VRPASPPRSATPDPRHGVQPGEDAIRACFVEEERMNTRTMAIAALVIAVVVLLLLLL